MVKGFAYIMGGATIPIPNTAGRKCNESLLSAFLNVGFHSSHTDCKGNGDVEIVDDLCGGQFDLHFCSLDCLQQFFNHLVQTLRVQIGKEEKVKKGRETEKKGRKTGTQRGRIVASNKSRNNRRQRR